MAILLSSGCATQRTYRYSWGDIIVANRGKVAEVCTPTAGRWDDGTYRPKHAWVSGCWIEKTGKRSKQGKRGDIWLTDRATKFDLIHELAHMDGVKDPEKEGYAD